MAGKSKIVTGALDALTDAYKRTFDPETYYHTTPHGRLEGDKFDPNFSLEDDGGLGATYFTKDKDYANEIAESWRTDDFWPDPEITIYPVKIKTDKIFDFKNKEQVDNLINDLSPNPDLVRDGKWDDVVDLIRMGNWEVLEDLSVQKLIKRKGYRGYKTSEPGTVALFHSDKGDVRSIFAKFDPKKSKSGDILASVPIGALATGGALSQLADEDLDF